MGKSNLLKLFDRPLDEVPDFKQEPVGRTALTSDEITWKLTSISFDAVIRRAPPVLELGEIEDLAQDVNFSLYIPKHRRIASKLISILLEGSYDDLENKAADIRLRVNPSLFNYCLSVALLHRRDTQETESPPALALLFPDKYLDGQVFSKAQEEAFMFPEAQRKPIDARKDCTAAKLEGECRLFYFREDISVNLYYWHWHLVYPPEGPLKVVKKDRRGELFYYMHQQIIARYNFERFCNNLKKVERLNQWKFPIEEAYFPKLTNFMTNRTWPARFANQFMSDVRLDEHEVQQEVNKLYIWRDRIFDAIHLGCIYDANGEKIKLTESEGIDILGNTVDSCILSPKRTFYGDLNSMGHIVISHIHDPDNRHLESFGVMGDPATAMRDPVFYRWHAFIDDMFQQFKATLPPYTDEQLVYPNITISDVNIESRNSKDNVLNTFWNESKMDLRNGMEREPKGSVYAKVKHLDHKPFTYKITVTNSSRSKKKGTVRIFLSPKYNEKRESWKFKDQRLFFIELDRFVVDLPKGRYTIVRHSRQSSVTSPFESTIRNVKPNEDYKELPELNFDRRGWPQHMLIPKGTPDGFQCELFVMFSNYKDDKVNKTMEPANNQKSSNPTRGRRQPQPDKRFEYGDYEIISHEDEDFKRNRRSHRGKNCDFENDEPDCYNSDDSDFSSSSGGCGSDDCMSYKSDDWDTDDSDWSSSSDEGAFYGDEHHKNPCEYAKEDDYDEDQPCWSKGCNEEDDQNPCEYIERSFENDCDEAPPSRKTSCNDEDDQDQGCFNNTTNPCDTVCDDDVNEPNSCNNKDTKNKNCCIRSRLYPDKRAMGFPFDRMPEDKVTTLEAFIKSRQNMKVQDITIKFNSI